MSTRRSLFGLLPALLIPAAMKGQAVSQSELAQFALQSEVCEHQWTDTSFRLTNSSEPVFSVNAMQIGMNSPIANMTPSGPMVSACSKCGVLKCGALTRKD
jgi:hypothetical protein